MLQILLWICGCYALTAAAVHAASLASGKSQRETKHYLLLAGNEQLRMEWYIRSIRRFSRRAGKEVRVTVLDNGSYDETMHIARCFAREGMNVSVGQVWPDAGKRPNGDGDAELAARIGRFAEENEGEASGGTRAVNRKAIPSGAGIGRKGYSGQELTGAVIVDLRNPADLVKLPL